MALWEPHHSDGDSVWGIITTIHYTIQCHLHNMRHMRGSIQPMVCGKTGRSQIALNFLNSGLKKKSKKKKKSKLDLNIWIWKWAKALNWPHLLSSHTLLSLVMFRLLCRPTELIAVIRVFWLFHKRVLLSHFRAMCPLCLRTIQPALRSTSRGSS